MRSLMFLSLVTATAVASTLRTICLNPDLDGFFTNKLFNGTWYEIGKMQTKGGAYFQKGCMCDVTEVTLQDPVVGNGTVTYTCRKDSVDGAESQQQTGSRLIYDGTPGHFLQVYSYPFSPALNYNVVYIDEDSAIEYDCGEMLGMGNYCVHFMSRQPTMAAEKLQALKELVDVMGLNTDGLEYEAIRHDGCW
ncbi:uncharacterized protein LOC125027831 [Penaeus chinensis]|uniref:uncharacterized protein LOC125027831 n=1 Tax=Penaeus chinensis TaxID=139456 RepID=UPI001FB745D8|nr:uncharacterized protein LOC125027831 [Penaeus chinensis]